MAAIPGGFTKMAKYRHRLPQLERDVFLTDGGIETTLICERCLLASRNVSDETR